MRLVLSAGVAALGLFACAHTVTNEERLDGLTDVKVDSTSEAEKMRCRDGTPEVQLARDRSQRKAERLSRYAGAIANVKETQARFDELFKMEPDLIYGPQAGEWKRKVQACSDLVVVLTKEQREVERETDSAPAPAAPAPAPVAEKPAEKSAPPAEEKKPAVAESAADEAFTDDADELRTSYKRKSKVAKAKVAKAKKKKSKKKAAELANR